MASPSPLHAGSKDRFAGSMAEAMESELNKVRLEHGLPPLPLGNPQTRILFLAIARGVVRHLKQHEAAFAVQVKGQYPGTGETTVATTGVES